MVFSLPIGMLSHQNLRILDATACSWSLPTLFGLPLTIGTCVLTFIGFVVLLLAVLFLSLTNSPSASSRQACSYLQDLLKHLVATGHSLTYQYLGGSCKQLPIVLPSIKQLAADASTYVRTYVRRTYILSSTIYITPDKVLCIIVERTYVRRIRSIRTYTYVRTDSIYT